MERLAKLGFSPRNQQDIRLFSWQPSVHKCRECSRTLHAAEHIVGLRARLTRRTSTASAPRGISRSRLRPQLAKGAWHLKSIPRLSQPHAHSPSLPPSLSALSALPPCSASLLQALLRPHRLRADAGPQRSRLRARARPYPERAARDAPITYEPGRRGVCLHPAAGAACTVSHPCSCCTNGRRVACARTRCSLMVTDYVPALFGERGKGGASAAQLQTQCSAVQ